MGQDSSELAARVTTLLSEPLTALSLVPVDVAVTTAGSRRVLRVLVDRDVRGLDAADPTSPVSPLSLDEVADATKAVGAALDADDVMGERPYTLEVSSPGVGRPLHGYAALRRNVGRLVALELPEETLTARIRAVTPDEVTVEVPAGRRAPAVHRTLPLRSVRSGRVQVEFGRQPGEQGQEGQD